MTEDLIAGHGVVTNALAVIGKSVCTVRIDIVRPEFIGNHRTGKRNTRGILKNPVVIGNIIFMSAGYRNTVVLSGPVHHITADKIFSGGVPGEPDCGCTVRIKNIPLKGIAPVRAGQIDPREIGLDDQAGDNDPHGICNAESVVCEMDSVQDRFSVRKPRKNHPARVFIGLD